MVFPWTGRRASRRAVSVISPLVEDTRRRVGAIDAAVWRRPYMIGLLSMLISLIAVTHARGRLRGERLGLAQMDAWMAITGLSDDSIGEEILLLSAMGDTQFVNGCDAARRIFACFVGDAAPNGALHSDYVHLPDALHTFSDPAMRREAVFAPASRILDLSGEGRIDEAVLALWRCYFEACLA